jgi:hypothetical protein
MSTSITENFTWTTSDIYREPELTSVNFTWDPTYSTTFNQLDASWHMAAPYAYSTPSNAYFFPNLESTVYSGSSIEAELDVVGALDVYSGSSIEVELGDITTLEAYCGSITSIDTIDVYYPCESNETTINLTGGESATEINLHSVCATTFNPNFYNGLLSSYELETYPNLGEVFSGIIYDGSIFTFELDVTDLLEAIIYDGAIQEFDLQTISDQSGYHGQFITSDLADINDFEIYQGNISEFSLDTWTPLLSGTGDTTSYFPFDSVFSDLTGNLSVTPTGSPSINTSITKIGGGSLYTYGSNAYLTTENFSLGASTADDWTIEFWLNPATFSDGGYASNILQYGTNLDCTDGFGLNIFNNRTDYRLWLRFSYGTSSIVPLPLSTNTWYHVALVHQNGILKTVINGQTWNGGLATDTTRVTNNPLRIGNASSSWSQSRINYIDDLRIYDYAKYDHNSTFAPPIGGFTGELVYDHGSITEFDLALTQSLYSELYHGQLIDFDIDVFGESLLYNGLISTADFEPFDVSNSYSGSIQEFELSAQRFIDGVSYHGSTAEPVSLQTSQVFYPEEIGSGEYAEFKDLQTVADQNAYHGSFSLADLNIFDVPAVYHGLTAEVIDFQIALTFSPQYYSGLTAQVIDLQTVADSNAYHGAFTSVTFDAHIEATSYNGLIGQLDTLDTEIRINSDVYHGISAQFAITDFGDAYAYHGQWSLLDWDSIGDIPAHHGQFSKINVLNIEFDSFSPKDFAHGAYSSISLLIRPSANIESQFYSGSYFDWASFSVTRSLYARPYSGSYLGLTLDVFPAPGLQFNNLLNGQVQVFDLALEQRLYPNTAYHGQVSNIDLEIRPAAEFDPRFLDGGFIDTTISITPALGQVNFYSGEYFRFSLEIRPAAELDAEFFHGLYSDIKYQILPPIRAWHGQRLRDAYEDFHWCCCSTSNTFEFVRHVTVPESQDEGHKLYIEFQDEPSSWRDKFGRIDPICNESTQVMQAELSVSPRFKATAYSGAHSYVKNFGEFFTDLTVDSINIRVNAPKIEAYLQTDNNLRFCPGYIIPNGNQVTFDFGNPDNDQCQSHRAYTGSYMDVWISTEQMMSPFAYSGALISKFNLFVPDNTLWPKPIMHGAWLFAPSEIEPDPKFYVGSNIRVEFERRGYLGYHGAYIEPLELFETRPPMKWATPEGCLVNQYSPLTEAGDPNIEIVQDDIYKEFYPEVALELSYFSTKIEATCAKINYEELE